MVTLADFAVAGLGLGGGTLAGALLGMRARGGEAWKVVAEGLKEQVSMLSEQNKVQASQIAKQSEQITEQNKKIAGLEARPDYGALQQHLDEMESRIGQQHSLMVDQLRSMNKVLTALTKSPRAKKAA